MAATNWTLLLLLFVVIFSAAVARPAPTSKKGPSSEGPIEFIHAECSDTPYPDVCFGSLSHSAATIQSDPVRLAWAATNLTLTQLQLLLGHTMVLIEGSSNPKEKDALHDCVEYLDAAAELTQQSAAEIGELVSAGGEEIGSHVYNAQTWLREAMTNENACPDVMEEVAAGAMNADMSGRVLRSKQFTSIALTLVNHLVP